MTDTPAAIAAPASPARLESVDLLRGLVMVVMAIDHVRDFLHFGAIQGVDPLDLTRTTGAVFLTRWITHFCAPIFSFLAGTGVCFALARGKSRAEMSWFLITRGAWLIVLELTLFMWFGWMFKITLDFYVLATLWSLGWSMIVLAGLIWLPTGLVAALGLALVLLHNAFDGVAPAAWGAWAPLWQVLHAGGFFDLGRIHFWAFYPLIPWPGVMALGYVFGSLYRLEGAARRRRLWQLGFGLTAAFVVLRATNLYGNPTLWAHQGSGLFTVLSFLNCAKYPPSLLYLLMALGPACLLLAWWDGGTPSWLRPLLAYGRVPMFYYVLHIPLIHAIAWVWAKASFGRADFLLLAENSPPNAGFGLPVVYAVWAAVVLALYLPCRWFADVKRRRREAWLSYF